MPFFRAVPGGFCTDPLRRQGGLHRERSHGETASGEALAITSRRRVAIQAVNVRHTQKFYLDVDGHTVKGATTAKMWTAESPLLTVQGCYMFSVG